VPTSYAPAEHCFLWSPQSVEAPGFEPRQAEPKSAALPLRYVSNLTFG
jgi:hypothetical protein